MGYSEFVIYGSPPEDISEIFNLDLNMVCTLTNFALKRYEFGLPLILF